MAILVNRSSASGNEDLIEATHRLMGDLSIVLKKLLPNTMTDEHYEALDDMVNDVFHQWSRSDKPVRL